MSRDGALELRARPIPGVAEITPESSRPFSPMAARRAVRQRDCHRRALHVQVFPRPRRRHFVGAAEHGRNGRLMKRAFVFDGVEGHMERGHTA
jgi:hypothetical protein